LKPQNNPKGNFKELENKIEKLTSKIQLQTPPFGEVGRGF